MATNQCCAAHLSRKLHSLPIMQLLQQEQMFAGNEFHQVDPRMFLTFNLSISRRKTGGKITSPLHCAFVQPLI